MISRKITIEYVEKSKMEHLSHLKETFKFNNNSDYSISINNKSLIVTILIMDL